MVGVDTITHDLANVRRHDDRNIEAIKESLNRFGQQKPIVVDANGVVVAGNGTLSAARSLGWAEIAVICTNLKGVEATAYAVADNRTAELAGWDYLALADQLGSLLEEGIDLPSIGWEPHEYEPLLQSDFDPAVVARGSVDDPVSAVRSLKLTGGQREILDAAVAEIRKREGDDELSEGQCVAVVCSEWLV